MHIDRAIVSGRRVSTEISEILGCPESRERFRHDLLEANRVFMSRKLEANVLRPIPLKDSRKAEKAIIQIRKQLKEFSWNFVDYIKRTNSAGNEINDPVENINIALSSMEPSVLLLLRQYGQAGHPGNKILHLFISETARAFEHLTGRCVPKSFDFASGEFVNMDLEFLFAVVSSLEPECKRSDITRAMRKKPLVMQK